MSKEKDSPFQEKDLPSANAGNTMVTSNTTFTPSLLLHSTADMLANSNAITIISENNTQTMKGLETIKVLGEEAPPHNLESY
ncbi:MULTISPECIES: hypothetical protein [unclassified Candidatus Tisiphia]|uniref:hypothetical protein n=1 Tax=unclassified Candidatus Tisiphia TaxID=2996318 RepID=UPI00312C8998